MIHELPQLDIFTNQTSKRLFFAKDRFGATVWHICDFAISIMHPLRGRRTMALHGRYMYCAIEVDTIDQLAKKGKDTDSICTGCLDAFNEAKQIIKERGLMKFSTERLENKPFDDPIKPITNEEVEATFDEIVRVKDEKN